jgi:hypothetical protein
MTAYYVQPEPSAVGGETYWLEGYAVGDAKFAAAQSDAVSATLAASSRVKLTGLRADGTSSSFFGGNRVFSGALVQEPVTATVSGVTRVRQGSIRADGASDTLIGGNRVFPLGALTTATSQFLTSANATYDAFALTRDLYVESGYWVTGYTEYSEPKSQMIFQPEIVKSTGASSLATSSTLAYSGRIRANIGSLVDANGAIVISANTVSNGGASSSSLSNTLAALSEKWLTQAEDQDVWSDVGEDADIWTNVSEDSDVWTDISPLT